MEGTNILGIEALGIHGTSREHFDRRYIVFTAVYLEINQCSSL